MEPNFEKPKRPRSKKSAEDIVVENPKKRRARKKIEATTPGPVVTGLEIEESVPLVKTERRRTRKPKVESSDSLDLVPDSEREDIIRDEMPVSEKTFISEPFENPIDIDELSFNQIMYESERNRFMREEFGTDNNAQIAKILDGEVSKGNAQVEIISSNPEGIQDTFDHYEQIPHNQITAAPADIPKPKEPEPIIKPIKKWPLEPNSLTSKPYRKDLFGRIRNWYNRIIDSDDNYDD